MNIAICGGTFDPFHRGHLEPVLAARDTMGWTRIIYVPAHRQPFKLDRDSASGYHRFTMAVLATDAIDDVFVSSWELEREGVSYTVDTLEHFREQYPEATIDWIIGDDNLEKLGEWKSLERIFALANFVVLVRGEAEVPYEFKSRLVEAKARDRAGAIAFATNAMVPISSTAIRERVRAGESIDAFVDPRVSRYIHHNGLYKGNA